jgi:hypothetical protein
MKYYSVKCTVERDGKMKKELYAVKATDLLNAETTTALELAAENLQEITDVNKKGYVAVIRNVEDGVDLGGVYYDCTCEWDEVDGKTVKDVYLIQAGSTAIAEKKLFEIAGDNVEIISTVKKSYIDYLEQIEG